MKQKVGAWKREKVEKALLAGVHGTAKPGEILARALCSVKPKVGKMV